MKNRPDPPGKIDFYVRFTRIHKCQSASNFNPQTASKIDPQKHITLIIYFTFSASVFKAITFISSLNNRAMMSQSV